MNGLYWTVAIKNKKQIRRSTCTVETVESRLFETPRVVNKNWFEKSDSSTNPTGETEWRETTFGSKSH